jgi:signal transduction histidine kinase
MQSASALIQKAVGADGVLFLDASVSGFGNLVSSTFLDQTPENDPDTTNSGTDCQTSEGEDVTPRVTDADNQPCPILGASYAARTGALPTPDARRDLYSQLTPKFLRSILRRSKGAKVWNFNEHGDDYHDEQFTESASDAAPARSNSINSSASNNRRDRKRSLRHAPGKQLAAAFPGVRSLMVLGLWDPQRNQWRAGCVIWSCTPMRVFSDEGEMHYLTAFCDVIMAKLARLDVDVANNTKSDFISSISHELRSPLHGILGTVEILQEQDVNRETAEMISQIDTCGRTLLDIVDHLLEFSRINVLTKNIGSKPQTNLKDQRPNSADKKNSDGEASALDADISLDVITEEVVESAVYSFCCSKDQRTLNDRNVTVSMDIEAHPSISWDCKVPIGAWKRVCVNLINNALKYTSEGSINVSLKILPPSNKMSRPVAQLSVVDTGRGMSKDFLRTKLFRAFVQEDQMAEGTGLGMSMVARIVKGWKGKIDVRSSKGQGSVVSVVRMRGYRYHEPIPTRSVCRTAECCYQYQRVQRESGSKPISLGDSSILNSILRLIRCHYGLAVYHLPHRNMLIVPLPHRQCL